MSLEPEKQLRQTRYVTLGLSLIGIAAVFLYRQLGLTSVAWIVGCGSIAGLVNLALLGRRSPPRVSPAAGAHVAVSILYGVLILSSVVTGGFYYPAFSWFYVVPMTAATVLDLRGAWAWVGITIATSLGFWALPYLGVQLSEPSTGAGSPFHALFNRVSAILALGLVATSFQVVQRRAKRELERANAVLRRESEYVQLLQHAAIAANEAASPQEAMRTTVARICTTMGWPAGHVYQLGDDGLLQSFEVWQQAGLTSSLGELGSRSFARGEGLPGRTLASGRPESIPNLESVGSDRADRACQLGLRSAVAVPVIAQGRVMAVLEFGCSETLELDRRFDEVLSLIGAQVGRVFERTELQDRLRQSQKMEAVGRLAAGLAHEINNPMAYVRSNLNQLRGEWQDAADQLEKSPGADTAAAEAMHGCHELICESLDGVERTIAIVRDVKDFSHVASTDREDSDLREVIESSIRVATPRASPQLRIERDFAELPRVSCSSNQIQQVLVNLMVNAIQAMNGEGCLRIATGLDGECAYISIEDEGTGIQAADCERLFEPFFTTKPVGEGTGLGLYVSYEIVSSHGGEIRVHSELGTGTRFEVRLPLQPDPRDAASA